MIKVCFTYVAQGYELAVCLLLNMHPSEYKTSFNQPTLLFDGGVIISVSLPSMVAIWLMHSRHPLCIDWYFTYSYI